MYLDTTDYQTPEAGGIDTLLNDPAALAERFAAWARQQEPGREYDFHNPTNCAFAQFLKTLGIAKADVDLTSWGTATGHWKDRKALDYRLSAAGRDALGGRSSFVHDEHDFGDLVMRLEEVGL